jgi:hypothetical protein
MKGIRVVATLPLWFVLVAGASPVKDPTPTPTTPPPTATPSASPSPSPAPSPSPRPSPIPSPTPTPVNAFLSLDVTAGAPNTQITVNGGAFLANESMTLYWDQPNKVAGSANADSSGNFTTHVKPFSGDAPGAHRLCASVPPGPCATFTLQAASTSPSPDTSPSPTASPDSSPSPTASPGDSPSPTPAAATVNGLDLMLKPPFVILPIIAGLGLAIALGYWILSLVMRRRQQVLKSVAVAHLASRPDYAAGFGTPPPAPEEPAPPPSAWADVLPPAPVPPPPAPPETVSEAAPPDTGEAPPAAPDEPPELPEPGDY